MKTYQKAFIILFGSPMEFYYNKCRRIYKIDMSKKDEVKWSIITILVILSLVLTNIWVGKPILRQIDRIKQRTSQKPTQMHIDSTWLTQLCIYELNKYHYIPNMVLNDKEFILNVKENMDRDEALIILYGEIEQIERQYLDNLHMFGEQNVIDYILDHRDTLNAQKILKEWEN